MSKISNLIFKSGEHYITSPFGLRKLKGKLNDHKGTDYGTNNKKLPQYGIESGYIFAAGKANSDGALYVWTMYPRIKKAFIHYHLDSYKVKAGQAVKKGTLLGYTGKTGNATGIHLHLGIRDLSKLSDAQINDITWALLRSCPYIDPEAYAKRYSTNPYTEPDYIVNRAKHEYKKGRIANSGVKWVQYELTESGLYSGKIDGWFGPITEQAVKAFQKNHEDANGKQLECDGSVGPLTRGALKNA